MKARKFKSNQCCPCGSGKKYKNCCSGKAFSWHENEDGTFSREIPLAGDLEEIIDSLGDDFVRHFGREPGAGDPVMLSKYLASPQDVERMTVEAMQKVGVDPAHIYAYKKTGYLIAESFVDRATGSALQEWDAAIDEFDAYGGEPPLPSDVVEFDELIGQLYEDIESLIYLIGLASDKFFNSDLLPTSSGPSPLLSPEQCQSLCAVRVHRTLRSIRMLLHEQMSDDVIKLVRSIYESYLHMSMVCHDPAKVYDLVDAVIGLRSGTHQYKKKKDGSDNKRIIVDIKTGQEFLGQISAYKMAASSGFGVRSCLLPPRMTPPPDSRPALPRVIARS